VDIKPAKAEPATPKPVDIKPAKAEPATPKPVDIKPAKAGGLTSFSCNRIIIRV